jgi:hypothetical protein
MVPTEMLFDNIVTPVCREKTRLLNASWTKSRKRNSPAGALLQILEDIVSWRSGFGK